MARDERTYIKLHDGMPDHPKVDGLSDAAFRLLIEMWCWCSRHLTDGHVPAATWVKRGSLRARRELEGAGLVESAPGGVLMHDYTEHQRTADEVAEQREKRRAAGQKGGLAKAANAASQRVAHARGGASPRAKHGAKQTGSKSVPETEVVTDVTTRTDDTAGLRPAADDGASASRELTETQRSKRITDAYAAAEPLCKWPAVNGIVVRAIRAGQWADTEITAALLRLAGEGRSVTVDTLRTELRGLPARHQPEGQGTVDYGLAYAAELAQREAAQQQLRALPGGSR